MDNIGNIVIAQMPEKAAPKRAAWVIPWWLLSIAIHAVLLLGLSFVTVEHYTRIEESSVMVTMAEPTIIRPQELTKPEDTYERTAVPKDVSAFQETKKPPMFYPGFLPNKKEFENREPEKDSSNQKIKGDSEDFLSYLPGHGGGLAGGWAGLVPGVSGSIGVGGGGGGGGAYGSITGTIEAKPIFGPANQAPVYPEMARQLGQEGQVIVSAEVDANGFAISVEISKSSGYELLDAAALKAIKKWLFSPAIEKGKPVPSKIEIPIRFQLN